MFNKKRYSEWAADQNCRMSEEDGWDLNWFDLPVIKPINFPDDYEDDDDVDQLTVEAEKSFAVADAATVDDNDTGTVVTQVDSLTQIDSPDSQLAINVKLMKLWPV